jgi:hypothetical protein
MGFRPVSHDEDDLNFYEQMRQALIKEGYDHTGVKPKLSMAQTIKLGMTFYNQRRKFVKDNKENEK